MDHHEFPDGPRNGTRYRFLAYMRVSHDLRQDNHTFETQLERIKERLNSDYGIDNYDLEVHQDDGQSGFFGPRSTGVEKRTRATLRLLEEKIKSRQYDGLAVYKMNRLFRNFRWMLEWTQDLFLPCGVLPISATENVDIKTAAGRLQLAVVASVDQNFRETASERCRDAHATRVEQGYCPGPPPYGWKLMSDDAAVAGQRRGMVRDPQRGEYLLLMKDLYLAGKNSVQIAAEFNRRRVPSSKGRKWSANSVLASLRHRSHAGYVCSKRKGWIVGQHYEQRYWDLEVNAQIEGIIEMRAERSRTNTGKSGSPHLVNGIAMCHRCGRRLYISTGTSPDRRYRCQSGANEGARTCPDVTVRAEAVEDTVVQTLENLANEPSMRELLLAEAASAADSQDQKLITEGNQALRALQGTEDKLRRLLDKLASGVIEDEQFRETNLRLLGQKTEEQQRLAQVQAKLDNRERREAWVQRVQRAVLDFPLCWEHLDLDGRRQLLSNLVEKLTVDKLGRDAIIRLKVYLLPEQEIPICGASLRGNKDRPLAVQALTRRQLVFLHYIGQGKSTEEIAAAMGTSKACVYQWALLVRRILGVKDLQSAYKIARARILSLLPNLPMGPTGNCGGQKRNDATTLSRALLEVLPYLSQGASSTEVADLLGIPAAAVVARRKRILEHFSVKSMFKAGCKAKEVGLLV